MVTQEAVFIDYLFALDQEVGIGWLPYVRQDHERAKFFFILTINLPYG
ncbi:hypothetical protein ACMHYO_05850 [Allopusillimonas ginsengisoli]